MTEFIYWDGCAIPVSMIREIEVHVDRDPLALGWIRRVRVRFSDDEVWSISDDSEVEVLSAADALSRCVHLRDNPPPEEVS